ncbi:hypothetical protein POM88_029626 [Heracleum sosnowskyi]|uniref:Uncharacterized protein n=1 Tax=Heracleum sosnowskyi TaxID=360622 RepID=A0AAD8HV31_9APIA|nr:hypothetical protein POM88_029626 [Heracleum sosnowskyi]
MFRRWNGSHSSQEKENKELLPDVKAWPVESVDGNGKPIAGHSTENGVGNPLYGPVQIGKAEPVNLQFGHFGISAWPSDIGGTSHANSVDESRGDGTENGSKYYSSCCSSPRFSDGPTKERVGGPLGMTNDWQAAPGSPSSFIVKRILRLDIPVAAVGMYRLSSFCS